MDARKEEIICDRIKELLTEATDAAQLAVLPAVRAADDSAVWVMPNESRLINETQGLLRYEFQVITEVVASTGVAAVKELMFRIQRQTVRAIMSERENGLGLPFVEDIVPDSAVTAEQEYEGAMPTYSRPLTWLVYYRTSHAEMAE